MTAERDDHGRYAVSEPELEARRGEVIKLRVNGYSFREIAAKLGIGLATTYADFKAVMDRTKAEADSTADQERQVSLARIDKAIAVLMPMVDAGSAESCRKRIADGEDAELVYGQASQSLDAMDRLDKLERRRAALLGLDAPTRTEVDATIGSVNPAVAARLVRETFGEHAAKRDSAEAPRGTDEVPVDPPAG